MALTPAERKRRYRERHPDRVREQNRKWREGNPEKKRAANAAWREVNPQPSPDPERQREYSAAWYQANKERRAETMALWRAANPERLASYRKTRRARRMRTDPDLTLEQWRGILDEFDYTCAYCQARGVPLEQEHMTPISRGGRHTASNVVPACRSCNARKGAKNLFEFAGMPLTPLSRAW